MIAGAFVRRQSIDKAQISRSEADSVTRLGDFLVFLGNKFLLQN